MKKFIVCLVALVSILSVTALASADEPAGHELEVKLFCKVNGKYYFADSAEGMSDDVMVGETINLTFSDFSDLNNLNPTGAESFGIMLVDDNNGEGSVTYHLSDVTIKSNGNSQTVSAEGTFTESLVRGVYEDDTAIVHELELSDGNMNAGSLSEVSFSVNYISYDDSGISTTESIPEEEEIPSNPATGIELLAAPVFVLAAAAMLISKSR